MSKETQWEGLAELMGGLDGGASSMSQKKGVSDVEEAQLQWESTASLQ